MIYLCVVVVQEKKATINIENNSIKTSPGQPIWEWLKVEDNIWFISMIE